MHGVAPCIQQIKKIEANYATQIKSKGITFKKKEIFLTIAGLSPYSSKCWKTNSVHDKFSGILTSGYLLRIIAMP